MGNLEAIRFLIPGDDSRERVAPCLPVDGFEVGERRVAVTGQQAVQVIFGEMAVKVVILKVITAGQDGPTAVLKGPSYDVIRPRAVLRMETETMVGEGSSLPESRFTLADGIHQLSVPAAQFRLILDELAHLVREGFTGPTRYIGVVLDCLNKTHERGRVVEIHRAASFLTVAIGIEKSFRCFLGVIDLMFEVDGGSPMRSQRGR